MQQGAGKISNAEAYCCNLQLRGVAQPGSVLAWGASGRRFESSRPDQYLLRFLRFRAKFNFLLG